MKEFIFMTAVEMNNLETLTPIHTVFGSNRSDLLVVEYDVPQTEVKQTLFYKYGQLSIPKWALIPASILIFGLLTAICAEIDGQWNCPNITKAQICDCPSTSYWTGSICTNRLSDLGNELYNNYSKNNITQREENSICNSFYNIYTKLLGYN